MKNNPKGPANKKKMKRWKKILLWFFAIIALLIIALLIFVQVIARKGLPDYNASIPLDKLGSQVTVYRDNYGTPHIYAESDTDLYRAVGYVMAQDRMWQMDLLRRVTTGRLSEIFGDDYIETDLLLRSLQYTKKSQQILKSSPPELIKAVDAFSDGVNQYIEKNKNNLPMEFFILGYKPEKWESYQSINLISYMAWDLKAGWGELLLEQLKPKLDSARFSELLPHIGRYKECVFEKGFDTLMASNRLLELHKLDKPGLDILCGSNNWAVSGKKSTTGKPILANDMHLDYNVPGIWMQVHEVVRGKLNVTGLALPGQPLIIVGHNDSIAWGMTNTYVDNLDYYEEKINPDNPDQYLYNGQWKDFEVHKEIIKSRNGKQVERIYRRNNRGPVVSGYKGVTDKVLTIHWAGDEPSNELLSIYKINRASDWNGFNDAFQYFRSISQNIVYADVKGNIGLHACAGVPIRKRDAIFKILPGWTDEYDWKGMIPYDQLPYEYNPSRGYVSSANNRTVDSTYPYHIGSWYSMPYRIERIRELLASKDKLSVDDFKKIQNDSKSKLAERIINRCFNLLDSTKMNKEGLVVYGLLKNWDGSMDKSLVMPTVMEAFTETLSEKIFKDEMGAGLFSLFSANSKLGRIALYNILENPSSPWIDNIDTPDTESFADVVNSAYANAVDQLAGKYSNNTDKWVWGNIHTLTLEHLLAKKKILDMLFNLHRGPYAVSGGYHTVSPYSYPVGKPSEVNHGASHRHIYSLINWDSTLSVIPTGNSGVIKSEFFLDQTKLYINGKYHSDYFSQEQVKKNAKYTEIFILPSD